MNAATTANKLAITQAKVTKADGSTEYYYSLPKVSPFNILGMLWLFRRLMHFKRARKASGERIIKVCYT